MPLVIRQVEKNDLIHIAKMDQITRKDKAITKAIWKIQDEEGISKTESFIAFMSDGMDRHGQTFWKVVDTDTNEMISVAKFSYHYANEEEAPKETTTNATPVNLRLSDLFATLSAVPNEFAKANFAGRPHAHLSFLVTHPKHQRRGAASMLMERGIQMADAAGLDFFLHASPEGKRLYTKFGFEELQFETVDLKKFGIDEVETRTYMKRTAKSGDENKG